MSATLCLTTQLNTPYTVLEEVFDLSQQNQAPGLFPANEHSHVKRMIAVMSGKGGVGKSSVTALIASELARRGNKVGVLDADITGPSMPKLFGVSGSPESSSQGLHPKENSAGVKVMSINLLIGNEDTPVVWRAPLLNNAVNQFWTYTAWGELDYLLVDLPPGTGDVPLTVLQSLPLDGVVMVMTPQDLAIMIVKKAVHMAEKMDKQVLGLVENMAYVLCPQSGEKVELFGPSKGQQTSDELGIPLLASLPIDPRMTKLADSGQITDYESEQVKTMVDRLLQA